MCEEIKLDLHKVLEVPSPCCAAAGTSVGAVAAGDISGLECCSESFGELKALKNKRQKKKKKAKQLLKPVGGLRRGEGGTKPQQTGKESQKCFFSLQLILCSSQSTGEAALPWIASKIFVFWAKRN